MSIWRKLHHIVSGDHETQRERPRQDRRLRSRRITLEPLEERQLLSATDPWTASQAEQIESNAAEAIEQRLVYPAIFDSTLGEAVASSANARDSRGRVHSRGATHDERLAVEFDVTDLEGRAIRSATIHVSIEGVDSSDTNYYQHESIVRAGNGIVQSRATTRVSPSSPRTLRINASDVVEELLASGETHLSLTMGGFGRELAAIRVTDIHLQVETRETVGLTEGDSEETEAPTDEPSTRPPGRFFVLKQIRLQLARFPARSGTTWTATAYRIRVNRGWRA